MLNNYCLIQDGGQYTCQGLDSRNLVIFEATTNLIIIIPPRVILNPTQQVVRPGKKRHIFSEFHIVKLSILFLWLPEYQSTKSDLLSSIQDAHSVYLIANRTESFAVT